MLAGLDDFFDFVHEWFGVPRGSLSLPSNTLPPILPEPLQRLYLNIGRLTEESPFSDNGCPPLGTQDCIYPPKWLKTFGNMIEFAAENQYVWSARCPIGGQDPPVFSNWSWVVSQEPFPPGETEFLPIGAVLSEFLVTIGLQELVFHGLSMRPHVSGDVSEKVRRDRATSLTAKVPLWINHNFTNCADWGDIPPNKPSHSFYISDDGEMLAFYQGEEPSGCYALRTDARRTT